MEELLENAHHELRDTVRMQQGMIFKYIERNGDFIHTLCDGELLYRTGLTPQQVIGKEVYDFLPFNEAKRKIEYYRKAWEGEENVNYEGQINGIWYLASLRPIRRGGQVVEVIGSCVDITEKKHMEKRLKEREFRYRLIAENTQDLIRVLDLNGIVKYASPSHKMILEIPPKKYEGNLFFTFIHHDDALKIQARYSQIVSTKVSCEVEYRNKHTDGQFENEKNYLVWPYWLQVLPIVQEHGGTINIKSITKKGTTVENILPIKQ